LKRKQKTKNNDERRAKTYTLLYRAWEPASEASEWTLRR